MNIELLERIAKQIEATPNRFDMDVFIEDIHECGSTACIAGWAVLLSSSFNATSAPSKSWVEEAALLGIDVEVCHSLFMAELWPEPYRTEYFLCYDKEDAVERWTGVVDRSESSQIAVRFIRDLIAGTVTLER